MGTKKPTVAGGLRGRLLFFCGLCVFSGVKQAGRLDMPNITRYSLRKEIQDKVLSLVNPVLSQIDVS